MINTLDIHLADHHYAADAYNPDHAADALDPHVEEESADPVIADEEPDHAGLDPQQEVAAAIATELKLRGALFGSGDIITPSWLDAIVDAALIGRG